jgi:hypothetical protein
MSKRADRSEGQSMALKASHYHSRAEWPRKMAVARYCTVSTLATAGSGITVALETSCLSPGRMTEIQCGVAF